MPRKFYVRWLTIFFWLEHFSMDDGKKNVILLYNYVSSSISYFFNGFFKFRMLNGGNLIFGNGGGGNLPNGSA